MQTYFDGSTFPSEAQLESSPFMGGGTEKGSLVKSIGVAMLIALIICVILYAFANKPA